ncbi:MAG TPA: hypothetical protein VGQ59_01580 [Cyclobacteriaceae bacterium]|jgi:hypothetical protein|nr:hypothetical protein [Cyclobacteriaceae bacterium]
MEDKSVFDFSGVPSYNWAELYYITYELDISLTSIKEAIVHHNNIIKNKRDALKEAVDKDEYLCSNESDDVKSQYYNNYYEHAEAAIDDLERILHNSTTLTIFSVVEGKVKVLCESIEKEIRSSIKIKDLKSNDNFDLYSSYLIKVFGMEQVKSAAFLESLKKYKIVRNSIAHQNSTIRANEVNLVKTLKHVKIETYVDNHILITSQQFLYDLTELVEKYISEVVSEIDQRWTKLKLLSDSEHRNS